jgi:small subunit ribosomal protein S8
MVVNNLSLAFSIILNGSLSFKSNVHVPTSKLNLNLINLLYKEGFIRGFFYNSKRINVLLKYTEDLKPVIKNIKIISTSGRRIIISKKTLSKFHKNAGTLILSTPKGLMTSQKAKDLACTGGEVLCKII